MLFRTTALVLVATAVPVASLVWASGVARAEVERRALDGLMSTAKATVLQEQQAWDDATRVITAAVSRPVPLTALQSRDATLAGQGVQNILVTGPFADVRLYDGTGSLVASAAPPDVTPTAFVRNDGPALTSGEPVRVGTRTARQVAIGIGPGGGGRLVVDVDLTQLLGQPSDLAFGRTGVKFLVTRAGVIVAGSTAVGTTLRSSLNRSIAAAGDPVTKVVYSPFFKRPTAESYEPIPGQSGMAILVQQSQSEVMGGADDLAALLRWAAVVVALLGAILAVGLRTFLRRRSRRLATTERRLAHSEAEARRRLEQFLDAIPIGVFVATPDGRPQYANREAARLLGRGVVPGAPADERSEIVSAYVAGTDERYPAPETPLVRALGGETTHVDDMELRRPGVAVPVEVWGTPVLDGDGSVEFGITAVADITSRREAQEGQARLASIVQAARDAILGKTLDGVVTSWNRGAEVLFGYTQAEMIGGPIEVLIPPEGRDDEAQLRARVARGLGVEHYETVRVRKNGTMVDVSATLSPIEDAAGRIVGIATICRDVTDRKQAEAALLEREEQLAAARDQALEASRLKSQFLANMSHEIRTPMNGVLGMAQLLLTGHLEPAQRRRAMRLHESGQSLLTIINDILDVSKMEAGKLELEETDFNLVSAVESVVSLCSSSANDKGLTLTVDVAPGTPAWVRGDALRLRQILVNIVGNAVKFTERGGVDIGIRQAPGGNVRFTVRDTGIGLDPSAKAYLLEPFSQADASTTRRFGGTGLGLAICRQLVELMGGVLDFTSEVGAGTTFWFELALPAAPDRDPAAVPAGWRSTDSRATVPAGAGPGPIDAATILLVDDVEINREVGKGLVERLGYQVDTVGSGAEAVDAVQRGAYTAVLMDCLMPVMDGYQATAVIRRLDGPVRCIPVIAVTAAAMSDDRDRCLAAGMTDYVSKPLELGRLAAVLARCLPEIAPAEAVLGEGGAQGEGVEAALADRLELIRSSLSPAAFDRICQVFLADTPDLIARLGAAAGAGDTDTARSVAHNLKGATATMGARRLSALAECLEAGVATTDAGALLREMAEEYDTARSVVLALMTPSPGG